MNDRNRPILVTGSHRSGSTWVGRMISTAANVGYIHEPFNLNHRLGINAYQFNLWFPYVTDQDEETGFIAKNIDNCLSFKYQWRKEIKTLRTLRDLGRMVRDGFQFTFHRMNGSRPLVKDPLAIFSVEWLVERFNIMPVILIRHPAAFVSSLKKAGWRHPFEHFIQQAHLMSVIEAFSSDIVRMAHKQEASIVEQGIVLWNVIHFKIKKYSDDHPDWYFCRHEDLCRDPVMQFRKIYEYLGLEFSGKVKKLIRAASSNANPIEAERPEDIFINSKKIVDAWKRRLTNDEIWQVREGTKKYWPDFYSGNEWT